MMIENFAIITVEDLQSKKKKIPGFPMDALLQIVGHSLKLNCSAIRGLGSSNDFCNDFAKKEFYPPVPASRFL